MPARFDREASLGHLLHLAARRSAQLLDEGLAPTGLRPAQLSVVLELAARDGLTQRELMTRLEVEQGTMAHTLARMARDGWVRREAHETDQRAGRWWLTDAAQSSLAAGRRAATRANDAAAAHLSPGDRAELIRLLHLLVHRAEPG